MKTCYQKNLDVIGAMSKRLMTLVKVTINGIAHGMAMNGVERRSAEGLLTGCCYQNDQHHDATDSQL